MPLPCWWHWQKHLWITSLTDLLRAFVTKFRFTRYSQRNILVICENEGTVVAGVISENRCMMVTKKKLLLLCSSSVCWLLGHQTQSHTSSTRFRTWVAHASDTQSCISTCVILRTSPRYITHVFVTNQKKRSNTRWINKFGISEARFLLDGLDGNGFNYYLTSSSSKSILNRFQLWLRLFHCFLS